MADRCVLLLYICGVWKHIQLVHSVQSYEHMAAHTQKKMESFFSFAHNEWKKEKTSVRGRKERKKENKMQRARRTRREQKLNVILSGGNKKGAVCPDCVCGACLPA